MLHDVHIPLVLYIPLQCFVTININMCVYLNHFYSIFKIDFHSHNLSADLIDWNIYCVLFRYVTEHLALTFCIYSKHQFQNEKKLILTLTCVLPAFPNVDSWRYGWSGDISICNTSLVMSSSLNTSFRHSD